MIPTYRLSQLEIDAQLEQLVEMLKPYQPLRVILYGSLARGDWNRASDVDLIIVKETDRPFEQRIGDVLALCQIDMAVEPMVYTPQEMAAMVAAGNTFLEKALAEGKVLYESQPE